MSNNYIQSFVKEGDRQIKQFHRNVNDQGPPCVPSNVHGIVRSEIEEAVKDGDIYDIEEIFSDGAKAFVEMCSLLAEISPQSFYKKDKIKVFLQRQKTINQIIAKHGFESQEIEIQALLDGFEKKGKAK